MDAMRPLLAAFLANGYMLISLPYTANHFL